jgi:pimeloyl-ACP methyl ester carboxylesterase
MTRSFLAVAVAVLAVCNEAAAQQGRRDLDVIAFDGAKLRATYWSPGKPGPGMLLLHQCNMDRRAWTELGAALADRGVHVLAIDYRGYGDSPRGGNRPDEDIDSALAALVARPGVDAARLAAGGASCGVRNSVLLARRSGKIRALMLLSGPTPDEGIAWLRQHPEMAILGAATAEEDFAVRSLRTVVATSTNPATTMRVLTNAGHGAPMFAADSTLLPAVVEWVGNVLR